METPLSPAVLEALSTLTEEQQLAVIAQVKRNIPAMPREERIKKLAELVGTMPKEDADEMMAIIDEGCGQINHNAW